MSLSIHTFSHVGLTVTHSGPHCYTWQSSLFYTHGGPHCYMVVLAVTHGGLTVIHTVVLTVTRGGLTVTHGSPVTHGGLTVTHGGLTVTHGSPVTHGGLTVTHGSTHCYTWQSSLLHMVASLFVTHGSAHCYTWQSSLLHMAVLTVTRGGDTVFTSIDAAPLKYHDTSMYCNTARMLEC